MVKHTQTIRWLLPTNCLSVFDHFEVLALKELKYVWFVLGYSVFLIERVSVSDGNNA